MPRFTCFTLLLLFAVQLHAQNTTGDGWMFKSEKEGVKVYHRQTTGIFELKLTTSINTNLHGLISLFEDASTYSQWSYKVTDSYMVHKNSETDFYYYARIDFPWPLSDRDVVMHATLYQNKDLSVFTHSVAVPDYIPEVPGVVRIRETQTNWRMFPGKDGWLYIEYYLKSDPGGNIPDWAVNMALESGPMETIKNIRKELKNPRYQTTRLAYIKD
ncbi:MAG: START domain-containing protein [Saprospiraceae bacterium]|nr:START domain-containing protein [Saprospiraceae bacterium]